MPPPVLSVSQVEDYDPEQLGGCPRRWWFERIQGHRTESTAAHEDGHQGHRLLAHYLTTGERPGRVRLGKAVNAVIDSGVLPAGSRIDLQVEQRFSGQPHRDAAGAWVPLDVTRTLWHAGHPWEGFIDLRWRSGSTVTVWDHKFSSDIHARALPADRLLRTVQMPIYALDTLRHWPDAAVFNLVHLYVSRRGVESFVRQQCVSADRIRERAEEVSGLVRQMDAVRGAAAQDDVPFNRAACHARTGCPHQFRCNAFKRRGTVEMVLDDEEMAMFGVLKDEPAKPAPVEVTKFDRRPDDDRTRAYDQRALDAATRGDIAGAERIQAEYEAQSAKPPTPARGTEPLPDAPAGRVTPPADLNLDDIFEAPVASTPKPQPAPTCEACGEVLTPENSSRLKTGDMKHIGCPADARAPAAAKLSPRAEAETGPRCENCPPPAHDGKRCEGRRGKGQCRCGEAVSHTPAFEAKSERVLTDGTNDDARGRIVPTDPSEGACMFNGACPLPPGHDGAHQKDSPEVEREEAARVAERMFLDALPDRRRISELEEQLRTAREIIDDPELGPRGSWSGTLAVNVTVELGPSTLAFIQSLLKR